MSCCFADPRPPATRLIGHDPFEEPMTSTYQEEPSNFQRSLTTDRDDRGNRGGGGSGTATLAGLARPTSMDGGAAGMRPKRVWRAGQANASARRAAVPRD